MGVHQTREFFLKKYGRIVDNKEVGPTLTSAYWKPGNSEMFLDLVKNLTGSGLTGDAWVRKLKEDIEELVLVCMCMRVSALVCMPLLSYAPVLMCDFVCSLVFMKSMIATRRLRSRSEGMSKQV